MQSTKTSTHKIHCFNPGHETAVLAGKANYTPAAIVRKMTSDLELLPLWYGEAGDYVFVDDAAVATDFISSIIPALRPDITPVSLSSATVKTASDSLEAAPWGWSPHIIRRFETLRTRIPTLSIPQWSDTLTVLTGRRTAADCLNRLSAITEGLTMPQFFSEISEICRFVKQQNRPLIIKTPYSSSGRGVRRINDATLDVQTLRWISGALRKQQYVSIEPALDKIMDFAMEFEADGAGCVVCRGLSVFDTSDDGAYTGNLLQSQTALMQLVAAQVATEDIDRVCESVRAVLEKKTGCVYRGSLGVDMMIYRRDGVPAIHPFVELNLRRTMGQVSINLFDRLLHPDSQGRFAITCQAAGEAYATHLRTAAEHTPVIENGKIRSGYFSLCPVNADTRYRAFIVVE